MSEALEADPLDELVDTTPVFIPAEMDERTLHRFVEDVAQKIHDYEVIARRYGFPGKTEMAEFIRSNEEIRRRIKVRRAIWESDGAAEVRARAYAAQGVIEGMPNTLDILFDKTAPATTRLEALKTHARIAGIDGMPAAMKENLAGGGMNTGKFSITINFPGAGTAETFATIEGDSPAPALTQE